jgi:hypothetical protein
MAEFVKIEAKYEGGGFFLGESSLWLKLSLYPEFQLPMCPDTGLKMYVVVVVGVVLDQI